MSRIGKILLFILLTLPCLLWSQNRNSLVQTDNPHRTLQFSGFEWEVKYSKQPMGPGGNFFSDSFQNVRVDEDGNLHLKIVKLGDNWLCSELICTTPLGYGSYCFKVDGRIDEMDRNVVLGLFLYDSDVEVDIEFSRWGKHSSPNGLYAVHPKSINKHQNKFEFQLQGNYSQHLIRWGPQKLQFESYHGHPDAATFHANSINKWSSPIIPSSKTAPRVHINLWLYRHQAPENGVEHEIVIKEFSFIPWNPNKKSHLPEK